MSFLKSKTYLQKTSQLQSWIVASIWKMWCSLKTTNKIKTKALKIKNKNQSAGCGFSYETRRQLSLKKKFDVNILHSVLHFPNSRFQMWSKMSWLISSGQFNLNLNCIQWDRCCYSANVNICAALASSYSISNPCRGINRYMYIRCFFSLCLFFAIQAPCFCSSDKQSKCHVGAASRFEVFCFLNFIYSLF